MAGDAGEQRVDVPSGELGLDVAVKDRARRPAAGVERVEGEDRVQREAVAR